MTKSFKNYYKEAFNDSKKALKGLGIFKYQILLLINILSLITIIPLPIVSLLNASIYKNIKKNKEISFTKAIKGFDNPISFYNIIISSLIVGLLFLGIIVLIIIITFILMLVGQSITYFTNSDILFWIYFSIPGAIALIIFILYVPFLYIPLGYIICVNSKLSLSKILYYSFNTLKGKDKKLLLINELIIILAFLVLEGIPYLVFYIVPTIIPYPYSFGLFHLSIALLILVPLFLIPFFSLPYSLFKANLYFDSIDNNYSEEVIIKNINLKANNSSDISQLFKIKENNTKNNTLESNKIEINNVDSFKMNFDELNNNLDKSIKQASNKDLTINQKEEKLNNKIPLNKEKIKFKLSNEKISNKEELNTNKNINSLEENNESKTNLESNENLNLDDDFEAYLDSIKNKTRRRGD